MSCSSYSSAGALFARAPSTVRSQSFSRLVRSAFRSFNGRAAPTVRTMNPRWSGYSSFSICLRIRSRSFSPVIFFEMPYRFIPSIITM